MYPLFDKKAYLCTMLIGIRLKESLTINGCFLNINSRKNGSMQNGTIQNLYFLVAINNRLYLCSAFGNQVPEIEY